MTKKEFLHIIQDVPSELKDSIAGDNVEKVFMKNRGLDLAILNCSNYHNKGDDQRFLSDKIYHPIARWSAFEHSEYGIKCKNEIHPFPTKRINNEFLGSIYRI